MLGIIFLTVCTIMFLQHWTIFQLGIRFDNFYLALVPYTIFTIAGLIVIFFASRYIKHRHPRRWYRDPHFLFLFVPISISQEIIYRSFLMNKLEYLSGSIIFVVLLNAILFAFIHSIYPHAKFTVLLGFLSGLGFASVYYYFPNLILISISHSILNFVAVWFGLFTLTNEDGMPKRTRLHSKYIKNMTLKLFK